MNHPSQVLRVAEHSECSVEEWLNAEQRVRFAEAARGWAETNRLPGAPIDFIGPRGDRLCTRQYVGVIEAEGVSVEIYPKLDAHLLDDPQHVSGSVQQSVMRSLLWMMDIAESMNTSEVDSAHLQGQDWSFYDIFAFLMVRHLARELRMGVPHAYVTQEDDSPTVRGRIQFQRQLSLNWNRMDRVACSWDEYTADIPLNRLFKCACILLRDRVGNPLVQQRLHECLTLLEEAETVTPPKALADVQNFRWDRSNERLRQCFEIAEKLLKGSGYALASGEQNTFVFLIDMNQLFESYCARVIAETYGVRVVEQTCIGNLLVQPLKIRQIPDLMWRQDGGFWIADVKYKHLAKGSRHSLSFEAFMETEDNPGLRADRVLSSQDIRQLIVYAEIHRHTKTHPPANHVAILYPFVGQGNFEASHAMTFNQLTFHLIPVRVKQTITLKDLIPPPQICA